MIGRPTLMSARREIVSGVKFLFALDCRDTKNEETVSRRAVMNSVTAHIFRLLT